MRKKYGKVAHVAGVEDGEGGGEVRMEGGGGTGSSARATEMLETVARGNGNAGMGMERATEMRRSCARGNGGEMEEAAERCVWKVVAVLGAWHVRRKYGKLYHVAR